MLYFDYNGITLGAKSGAEPIYFVESVDGLDADAVTNFGQSSPGNDGEVFIDFLRNPRRITVYGVIQGTEATQKTRKQALMAAMGGFANSYINDKKTLKQLTIVSDTGTRYIDCYPQSVKFAWKGNTDGYQKFAITFYCPSPYFYGAEVSATGVTATGANTNTWTSICFSESLGLFCAVSLDGTNRVMTSPDGINWTARSAAENNTWLSVCFSESLGLFCAVSQGGTNRVMTSPDGITWTARSAAENNQWYSVCFSESLGLFCAVSIDGTNRVMTSPDGINWTARSAISENWFTVCFSESLGLFCAVARNTANSVMTSPDGINWTQRSAISGAWISVCFSEPLGLFCAVSTSSTFIMTSPDGINWTAQTAAENNGWQSVCFSESLRLFVAVAGNGTNRVMTSPDGINWTSASAAAANNWYSVCFSELLGLFVSVGSGSITTGTNSMVSTNGTNWSTLLSAKTWIFQITNTGQEPCPMELTVPILAGGTGDYAAITLNTLYDGSDSQDYQLKISTNGLPIGSIVINSAIGQKTIKQFGKSIMAKLLEGNFFGLYSDRVNTVYVYLTDGVSTAPTLKYKPLYLAAN